MIIILIFQILIQNKMIQNNKIALIGGTGKSGKYLTQHLLNKGFAIKMLVRNPVKLTLTSPLIEVVKGDVRDFEIVRSLLIDCNVVISTLGNTKDEPPVFTHATSNILKAMNENEIRRYILVAGLSVNAIGDKKSIGNKFKTKLMQLLFPSIVNDRQKELEILKMSDSEWTLVRLPFIKLNESSGEVKVKLEDCPGKYINAGNLAEFIEMQITDTLYLKKAPFISN